MRLEPTKLILIGTPITYQATGDASYIYDSTNLGPVKSTIPLPSFSSARVCVDYLILLRRPFAIDPPLHSRSSPSKTLRCCFTVLWSRTSWGCPATHRKSSRSNSPRTSTSPKAYWLLIPDLKCLDTFADDVLKKRRE